MGGGEGEGETGRWRGKRVGRGEGEGYPAPRMVISVMAAGEAGVGARGGCWCDKGWDGRISVLEEVEGGMETTGALRLGKDDRYSCPLPKRVKGGEGG